MLQAFFQGRGIPCTAARGRLRGPSRAPKQTPQSKPPPLECLGSAAGCLPTSFPLSGSLGRLEGLMNPLLAAQPQAGRGPTRASLVSETSSNSSSRGPRPSSPRPFYWTPPERCPFARRPRAGGGKQATPRPYCCYGRESSPSYWTSPVPQQPREVGQSQRERTNEIGGRVVTCRP